MRHRQGSAFSLSSAEPLSAKHPPGHGHLSTAASSGAIRSSKLSNPIRTFGIPANNRVGRWSLSCHAVLRLVLFSSCSDRPISRYKTSKSKKDKAAAPHRRSCPSTANGTRTRTARRPGDFKSPASTIPPSRQESEPLVAHFFDHFKLKSSIDMGKNGVLLDLSGYVVVK